MILTVGGHLLSWGRLILLIALIKLIILKIEDIPAKCKLKIAISTDGLECPMSPDSRGYKVQPVPAPSSTKTDIIKNSQKLLIVVQPYQYIPAGKAYCKVDF